MIKCKVSAMLWTKNFVSWADHDPFVRKMKSFVLSCNGVLTWPRSTETTVGNVWRWLEVLCGHGSRPGAQRADAQTLCYREYAWSLTQSDGSDKRTDGSCWWQCSFFYCARFCAAGWASHQQHGCGAMFFLVFAAPLCCGFLKGRYQHLIAFT